MATNSNFLIEIISIRRMRMHFRPLREFGRAIPQMRLATVLLVSLSLTVLGWPRPGRAEPVFGEIERIFNSCETEALGPFEAAFDTPVANKIILQFRWGMGVFEERVRIPVQDVEVYDHVRFSCREPGCIIIHTIPFDETERPRTRRRSDYLFPWCKRREFAERAAELLRSLSGPAEWKHHPQQSLLFFSCLCRMRALLKLSIGTKVRMRAMA
jgi:hypothetical protein